MRLMQRAHVRNSRNYVRGILKERTGNEIKKRRCAKKGKKKTHKVTFNFCELVGLALRLLLDCTEDLFDQSPIELS